MFKVQTLNKIAKIGTDKLGEGYEIADNIENPDAIILRSFNMHEMDIPASVKGVARAGAGVNNIPIDKCSEKGIVVFNTPGANANAVKELAIAGLLLASRKVTDAVDWAKTLKGEGDAVGKLVEKGKSNFAGPEIYGKTLGVVGLGAIGVMVANAAYHLGMEVMGYDPFISVEAAWGISRHVEKANDLGDMISKCDYISLHLPLNDNTRGMINKDLLAKAKDGLRVLNFARGELVDSDDIIAALESGKVASYVTDFPDDKVIGVPGVVAIPHLGASTPESEDNCAVMAAKQLKDFLENGNVKNSVNFPTCVEPRTTKNRIFVAHKNVPNMLATLSGVLADRKMNIEHLTNKSKKELAITLIDTDDNVTEEIIKEIEGMADVLSVRLI
ncbi:MAG: 3-phosphoglycerate dehydrogenase [Clostridia bacterium]|nr:3-phosphoglycerate dehydrogenase [Clostridia bacterium]